MELSVLPGFTKTSLFSTAKEYTVEKDLMMSMKIGMRKTCHISHSMDDIPILHILLFNPERPIYFYPLAADCHIKCDIIYIRFFIFLQNNQVFIFRHFAIFRT